VEGVFFLGGNDLTEFADPEYENTARERDATERSLVSYCIEQSLPLLGVCRGMQAINMFWAARSRA
jgi:putative glutamine amidotransferase